jgi:uncharacterized tellurite resistance protein B-like protein
MKDLFRKLLDRDRNAPTPPQTSSGDTETVRAIARKLDALDPERARFIAAFAFVLSRVANADLDISEDETLRMEEIVTVLGQLPEEQAVLAVQIAKTQSRLFGATEDFLVTRELKQVASREQLGHVLESLFAVAAADDSISSAEEEAVRQIATELGFDHAQFSQVRSQFNEHREVLRAARRARGRA